MSDATRRAAGRTTSGSKTSQGAQEAANTEVAGLVAEASATRSGEDSRRRGWFWHWNSVVTQYAPLIGLKGVGLLNSYTVWTDRRDESPHRGYAFPSQQSEADFYGEDRAELITINKILVALNLIEIRKEMILKADDRGRRWRVPHNFYRVKDHDDGFALSTPDVLKVVELADTDPSVYRYVRRVFSKKFAPIGPDNIWHRLLPELRQSPTWERLAARTAADEDRASARTRAGHANRKTTATVDDAAPVDTGNDSVSVATDVVKPTIVARSNSGSGVDVGGTNKGSAPKIVSTVAPSNDGLPSIAGVSNKGRQTAVAPGNTMYDVSFSTTTTTTNSGGSEQIESTGANQDGPGPDVMPTILRAVDPLTVPGVVTPAAGPGTVPPTDAPSEAAAARAFEDANARPATPAERRLLRELAARFESAAAAQRASGWNWVAAAIYEAVAAGSAFVAPRRIGEILTRWERDGVPASAGIAVAPAATQTPDDTRVSAAAPAKNAVMTGAQGRDIRSNGGQNGSGDTDRAQAADPAELVGEGPDIHLPHGYGARRTWRFVVGLLGSSLDRETLGELVRGTAIVGYRDGEVTVAAADVAQAERLATTHRDLVSRKLGEALRRPVRLVILAPDPGTQASDDTFGRFDLMRSAGRDGATETTTVATVPVDRAGSDATGTAEIPVFPVPECGLGSDHVWATVMAEVVARGDVSRANVDTWLRTTALIGRNDDGGLVVGAGSTMAQRRIAGRFLPPLRAAAAAVLGMRVEVEVVVTRDWLLAHPGGTDIRAIRLESEGA